MLTIFTDSYYVHACVLGTWMTQYTELARFKMSENAVTLERKRFSIDIIRLYRDWKRTHKNIHARCSLGSVNSPYIVCY